MNITLSILIPTYNRAKYLNWLLISILEDFYDYPTDLELIILDNDSTDETTSIVNNFISQKFPIRYIKNATNIGMDGNIAACFNESSGKYLWVIGDDEIMYKGTTSYLLNLCRSTDFGLLHIASRGFLHAEQEIISSTQRSSKINISRLDSADIFKEANIFLTFISANIVNRSTILTKLPAFDAKAELGSYLPHLAWIYSILAESHTHYIIKTPLFGALGGNTSGYKLVKVFGVNLSHITKKYLEKIIPNAERIMANAAITRVISSELKSQIEKANSRNSFEKENVREVLTNCFGTRLYFKIFLIPLISQSTKKRKIAFFCLRIFNKINQRLGYFFF